MKVGDKVRYRDKEWNVAQLFGKDKYAVLQRPGECVSIEIVKAFPQEKPAPKTRRKAVKIDD